MSLKSLLLSPGEVPIALANSKSGRAFATYFIAKMPQVLLTSQSMCKRRTKGKQGP